MRKRHFMELLQAQWARDKFICVGLDSNWEQIPESARMYIRSPADELEQYVHVGDTLCSFNRAIIEATCDIACAFKPNAAFYERHGHVGLKALKKTIADIKAIAPEVPVLLDFKRTDIGNTNLGYVQLAFDYLRADAVVVHPYFGKEALAPFLCREEKGIIVLCRTSNRGASEFQDLPVVTGRTFDSTVPLYLYVAMKVAKEWNENKNCALVVGATYPGELRQVRENVEDMPLLIPGVGAQGADVAQVVHYGRDSRGWGMIINSSRGIIFASRGADFAIAARNETKRLHELVSVYRDP